MLPVEYACQGILGRFRRALHLPDDSVDGPCDAVSRILGLRLLLLLTLSGGVGGCAHLWPPWPFNKGDDWEIGRSTRFAAYSRTGLPPATLETLEQSYAVVEASLFPGRTIAPVDVVLLDWPDFQGAF